MVREEKGKTTFSLKLIKGILFFQSEKNDLQYIPKPNNYLISNYV